MSSIIWNSEFSLKDFDNNSELIIKMPAFAEILTIGRQHGDKGAIQVWYRCSPESPLVDRKIIIVGTGWNCQPKNETKYISTCFFAQGSLVFHFFEPKN